MLFFEADAVRLPFADASFDLVTSAFGFRNLVNYEAGLREIQRVLKSGDTLSKIAKQQLGDPNAYMEIFNANRDQLSDPDEIKPGQVLKIPQTAKP